MDKLLEKIKDLKSDDKQKYAIIIVLLTENIQSDGGRGIYFLVGTYPDLNTAEIIKSDIIKTYGQLPIKIVPTCEWNILNSRGVNSDAPNIETKDETKNETKNETRTNEGIKKETEMDKYIHKLYLAIRNKVLIDDLKSQIDERTVKMRANIEEIKIMNKDYPNFKEECIDILKEKFTKNGETEVLDQFLKEFKKLEI